VRGQPFIIKSPLADDIEEVRAQVLIFLRNPVTPHSLQPHRFDGPVAVFQREGDAFEHTCRVLDALDSPDEILALGALLHDSGKPDTQTFEDRIRFNGHAERGEDLAREICRRLRLGAQKTARIAELVRHHMRFKDFPDMRNSTKKRFFLLPRFERHLGLHRADRAASDRSLDIYEAARAEFENMPPEEINPPPLLTGRKLMVLGFKSGPFMGEILNAVRDAQLEGELSSEEEAIEFVRKNWKPEG